MGEAKKFGRYEVRDTIGRGAMGVVYLAEDPVIGRQVAIKVVESHEGLEDFELEQLNARFEREFQSAGSLSHPNIVSVHDVGLQDGNTFIAMEYVQGESLSSILAANRAFSFKEIADMAAQLSSGLDYAHEFDIVHRDIKPANILITRDGRPKITDFGVAKVATTTLTRTGTVVGTPAYMSPEQVTGHPVAGTADQFSLAVMLYQMLTGERPFSGENPTTIMYKIVHEEPPPPSALNVTVPAAVDTALLRALAKNPVDRYPTCTDLANALRDALGAAPSAATMVMGAAAGEETVFDASIAQSHHLPAKDTDRRFSVGMLAAVAASVIVGALGVWAWSSGILGGGPVEPGEPARVEITLNLNIQAPPDLAIWVDGRDSGLVTPQALPLSGLEGESVVVELRYNGEVLVSQTVPLASDTADTWIPERIDAIVAEAVRGGDAVATPGDEPTAEEPPAPVLFTITSSPAGGHGVVRQHPARGVAGSGGGGPVRRSLAPNRGRWLRPPHLVVQRGHADRRSARVAGVLLPPRFIGSARVLRRRQPAVRLPGGGDRGTAGQYQRKNAHVRGLRIAQYPTATRQLPNQPGGARHLLGERKEREHRLRRARECGSAPPAERADCCQSRQLCDQHRRPRSRALAGHAAVGIGAGI